MAGPVRIFDWRASVDEGGERHGSGLQVASEEVGLVGDHCFERCAEVDVEMAGVVALDLARGAVRA
jgi:hypothetical protein